MTVNEMVKYLRLSVNVHDPEGATKDSVFLSMTDEDLLLYLNIALTRDFSSVPSLDLLPSNNVYGLMLLARKDLYYTLATAEAPLFDLGADNNNYLKRSQRFEHYMALIKQADDEYKDFLENSAILDEDGNGRNTLTSYSTYLPSRWYTHYNYLGAMPPVPVLYVREVGLDYICLEWKFRRGKPYMYKVYVGKNKLIDEYETDRKVICPETLFMTIRDPHKNTCKIEGLECGTEYHVALGVIDVNSLAGYAEVVVETMTLDKPKEEEPVNPDMPSEPPVIDVITPSEIDGVDIEVVIGDSGNFINISGEISDPKEETRLIFEYTDKGGNKVSEEVILYYKDGLFTVEPSEITIDNVLYTFDISGVTLGNDNQEVTLIDVGVIGIEGLKVDLEDDSLVFSGNVKVFEQDKVLTLVYSFSDSTKDTYDIVFQYKPDKNVFATLLDTVTILDKEYRLDVSGVIPVQEDIPVEPVFVDSVEILHRTDITARLQEFTIYIEGLIENPEEDTEQFEMKLNLSDGSNMIPTFTLTYADSVFSVLPSEIKVDETSYFIDDSGIFAEFYYSVSGTISIDNPEISVEGIQVYLNEFYRRAGSYTTVTDSEGFYNFDRVTKGKYILSIATNDGVYEGYSKEIEVVSNNLVEQDVELEEYVPPTYSISGTVTLEDGITTVVTDIPLNLYIGGEDSWTLLETKNPDAQGNFVFDGLSNGEYQIEVEEKENDYKGAEIEVTINSEDVIDVDILIVKIKEIVSTLSDISVSDGFSYDIIGLMHNGYNDEINDPSQVSHCIVAFDYKTSGHKNCCIGIVNSIKGAVNNISMQGYDDSVIYNSYSTGSASMLPFSKELMKSGTLFLLSGSKYLSSSSVPSRIEGFKLDNAEHYTTLSVFSTANSVVASAAPCIASRPTKGFDYLATYTKLKLNPLSDAYSTIVSSTNGNVSRQRSITNLQILSGFYIFVLNTNFIDYGYDRMSLLVFNGRTIPYLLSTDVKNASSLTKESQLLLTKLDSSSYYPKPFEYSGSFSWIPYSLYALPSKENMQRNIMEVRDFSSPNYRLVYAFTKGESSWKKIFNSVYGLWCPQVMREDILFVGNKETNEILYSWDMGVTWKVLDTVPNMCACCVYGFGVNATESNPKPEGAYWILVYLTNELKHVQRELTLDDVPWD